MLLLSDEAMEAAAAIGGREVEDAVAEEDCALPTP